MSGGAQRFLDNLEYLRTVASVAVDHLQRNRDEFAKNATADEVLRLERTISDIRSRVEVLEKELQALEQSLSGKTAALH